MKREYVEKAAWDCVNAPCIMDCSQCEDKYKEDCIWSHLKDGFVLGEQIGASTAFGIQWMKFKTASGHT